MDSQTVFRICIGLLMCFAVTKAQNNYVDDYDEENLPPPQPRRPAYSNSKPPSSSASSAPRPTPVPILKQIDRHNDDGSYTYGYEGADGSFKIETKLVDGEVMGKYGYVDDTGKVRVVEYGANRYGFQPAGEGITVAPPTLVDETTDKNGKKIPEYYPDEPTYYQPEEVQRPAPRPAPVARPAPAVARPAPAVARPAPRPAPRPQPLPLPEYEDFPPFPSAPAAPSRAAPSSGGSGPVPPRAAIPGAAPVFSPAPVYESPKPQHRSFSPPARQSRPSPSAQSAFDSFAAAAPARHAAPAAPQQPPHSRAGHARTSGGILDQLEKDYALPGGVPTHDISFGLY